MNFTLEEFLEIESCTFNYNGPSEKLMHSPAGVSIDSRTIRPNEIYFALQGENHDGHDFVIEAFKKEAFAAVVETNWWLENKHALSGLRILVVNDSLAALQESARAYRKKFDLPIIALTGTNGKTTTKEMVAAVLSEISKICKTEGNLNNHIGLPLSLFKLDKTHKAMVIEMGMNHPGEIAHLCEIAQPGYGLITNIGRGHLKYLKTLSKVAKAKMELFDYLEPEGIAFINLDDKMVVKHAPAFNRQITYGFNEKANVLGKLSGTDEFGFPMMEVQEVKIKINCPGNHNLRNALAAVAVGTEFGVSIEKMKSAIEGVKLPGKRMEVIKHEQRIILNDAYNANPDSVMAALQTLKSLSVPGKKIFVMGDMLELGEQAQAEHAKIGSAVHNYGVDVFFAYGPLSAEAVEAAKKQAPKIKTKHFTTKQDLISALKEKIGQKDVLLVKGSRGMKMEEIAEALLEKE